LNIFKKGIYLIAKSYLEWGRYLPVAPQPATVHFRCVPYITLAFGRHTEKRTMKFNST